MSLSKSSQKSPIDRNLPAADGVAEAPRREGFANQGICPETLNVAPGKGSL